MSYNEHPDKSNWEHRITTKIFSRNPAGIHQGIYVATPSGQLLARVNAGWPDPDADETLRLIKQAVARYKQIPVNERIITELPNPQTDRLKFKQDQFSKPKGTLDLRVTKRGYAFPGMTTFDERHPKFFGIDRLWFKPSEYQQFIPRQLTTNASVSIKGPALERWILHNHMQKACSAWWPEHIKQASLTSTITGISGDAIDIELKGTFQVKADSEWNTGSYQGTLLGKATYNQRTREFIAWESVMYGKSTLGKLLPNAHVGDPSQMVATYATINPLADADDAMVPSDWLYGYGLNWCLNP